MDALPLEELVNVPYKSKIHGKMHACGHDCHTANLLGVGLILNELKKQFSGTVKLMFQPSEETGVGGALPMVEAGILKNPQVDAAFGLHTGGGMLGTTTFQFGSSSGCPDDFKVELFGSGGHGAGPHKTTDLISVGAQFIANCQMIVTRRLNPQLPALITFGEFKAGNAHNIIAPYCLLSGTCRSNNEKVRKELYDMFEDLLKTTCATNKCQYKFEYG
jgi:amidohydrolase